MHIERTAVNDASFACPDNSGLQLQRQQVIPQEPLDARRHPALPLEAITAALANDGHSVAVSDDAGRFLCNYTMYPSLARCHPLSQPQAGSASSAPTQAPPTATCGEETAMFVHVPPHHVLSHDQLLQFAHALLAEVGTRVARAGGLQSLQRKASRTLFKHPKPQSAPANPAVQSSVDSKSGAVAAPAATAAAAGESQARRPPSTPAAPALDGGGSDPRVAASGPFLQDMQDMGFSRQHALTALAATGYRNIDAALDWAVEHPSTDEVPHPPDEHSAGVGGGTTPSDVAAALKADSAQQQAAVSSSALAAQAALEAAATPAPARSTAHSGSLDASLAAMLSQWSFDLKLVLLVRQDLQMSAGKIAAQCSHAAIAAATQGDTLMNAQWQGAGEKIVVLGVQDAETVRQLSAQARAAGLQVHSITDAGRTEVEPGTQTVTAIGPAFASAIDQVTGHLKTL